MYYSREVTLLLVLLLVCFQLRNAAVDDIAEFIFSRIPELRGQARPRGREQFAALIFLDQTEVHDTQRFQFNPHNHDGTPVVNNRYSYRPAQPMNYVVARPEHPQHAEEIILEQLPNMWNTYQETRGTPAMILLFTRLYPCTAETPGRTRRCAERIRAVLGEAPYNNVIDTILSYNIDDAIIAPDFANQNVQFLMARIMIQALPMDGCFNPHMKRSVEDELVERFPGTCTEPTFIQSYQGCILQRLGDDAFTCIKHDAVERQKAYLMNILVDRCLFNNQRDTCFMNTFLQNTGNACYSLQKQIFVDKLKSSLSVCSLKPISQPCQESRHFDLNIALMTSADQRTNYTPPEQFGCFNERHTGLLCSNIDDRYLTAGNSLCRSGHPCGYHEKEYSWCYTTTEDNWDYCCSGSCGYHGNDYLWCESGNTWQYCGKGGSIATGSQTNMQPHPCLVEHQCGLHHDYSTKNDYYWCYIDAYKNWDYCCSPEPDDNECTYNGGTSYKWCKVSYYKTAGRDWEKCYY